MMAKQSPRRHPMLASSILRSLVDRVSHEPEVLKKGLAKFNISRRVLNDHHGRLRMDKYLAFFDWLAKELNEPVLGLKVSQAIGAEMLNAVSYLFLCSKNLESSLTSLAKYAIASQDGILVSIVYEDELLHARYKINEEGVGPIRQDCEYSIGFMWNLMVRSTGGKLSAVQIHFEHDKPKGTGNVYRRIFNAPVLFQQEQNAIVIRRADAQQLSRGYDPNLVPILTDHLEESLTSLETIRSFSDDIRTLLSEEAIAQGARAKRIARELGISEVTLHRKLRKEGASFKKIYDDRAKAIASRLVEKSQYKISDIATRLGYAETACFTRAFQRWFGVSPRQHRSSFR